MNQRIANYEISPEERDALLDARVHTDRDLAIWVASKDYWLELAAQACDEVADENNKWIKTHPKIDDAFKHADGASDGAAACADKVRALQHHYEGYANAAKRLAKKRDD